MLKRWLSKSGKSLSITKSSTALGEEHSEEHKEAIFPYHHTLTFHILQTENYKWNRDQYCIFLSKTECMNWKIRTEYLTWTACNFNRDALLEIPFLNQLETGPDRPSTITASVKTGILKIRAIFFRWIIVLLMRPQQARVTQLWLKKIITWPFQFIMCTQMKLFEGHWCNQSNC